MERARYLVSTDEMLEEMLSKTQEYEALIEAEFYVSKDYHILLLDIKKLLGVRFIPTGLVENKIN